VDEGSASVDYLFSPLQGAHFAVERPPTFAWNGCPVCRGITARIGVEYSIMALFELADANIEQHLRVFDLPFFNVSQSKLIAKFGDRSERCVDMLHGFGDDRFGISRFVICASIET
jgi:hypothetical protein